MVNQVHDIQITHDFECSFHDVLRELSLGISRRRRKLLDKIIPYNLRSFSIRFLVSFFTALYSASCISLSASRIVSSWISLSFRIVSRREFPLPRLHSKQEVTRFSTSSVPPWLSGMTWPISSMTSGVFLPQYLQVKLSQFARYTHLSPGSTSRRSWFKPPHTRRMLMN